MKKQVDSLVRELNIKHSYDDLIKDVETKYKLSLGLPNISTNELLSRLLELKHDKMYVNLKTLIDYKELLEDKTQYIKDNI